MKQFTINEEIQISASDGFHQMSDEERAAMAKGQSAPAWCMTDPEKHMIVSASWKAVPKWTSLLLSAKDMAKKMRVRFEAAAEGAGYSFGELREINIGGKKAYGYPFSYMADGIAMCGDSVSLKLGSTFYFFHTYYREEQKEESCRILEEVYQQIVF